VGELNQAQQQVIALLGKGDGAGAPSFEPDIAEQLQVALDDALSPYAGELGDDDPLWVSKHALGTVHGCEAHHVASQAAPFEWSVPTVRGTVAHKAIELAVHWRGEAPPMELVDEALARLQDSDRGAGRWLQALAPGQHAQLRGEATDLVAKFLECFPPLKKEWWPVTESRAQFDALGGKVVLSGKVDLTLGRPQATPTKVIIDLKSGMPVVGHREDLRFYALLETMRLGTPPRKLATYYLDAARAQPEDVTPDLLHAALRRTIDGVRKMIELRQQLREPAVRPGVACRWCPIVDDCAEGRAHLAAQADDDA
jgi:hypothetical protein